MSEETDEPFLVAPNDEAVTTLSSIKEWPSVSDGVQSDQLCQSSADAVRTFQALSSDVQTEFAAYPGIVKEAFRRFADSGDSSSTVEWIIEQMPAMLLRKDRYGCIPIEVAFESSNASAVRLMLKVAECSEMLERLLAYRNQQRCSLMMLAVNLNSPDCADIIQQLMIHDPHGVHRFYDNDGMNVFHKCTRSGFQTSFGIMMETLTNLHNASTRVDIKGALEMTDKSRCTPIHYICACGKVDMLDRLQELLICTSTKVNFDVHFHGPDSQTPLMVGVEKGNYEVCKWLLEKGSVNVHCKQHATCLTALHFAVKTGNLELISLLMEHGADAKFCDSECDELPGYKTPVEMAGTENIPNKEACIKCLTEPYELISQTSKVRLGV